MATSVVDRGGAVPASTEHTAEHDEELVAAAVAGDQAAFSTLAERYRRELHVHCYRMLGSYDEAEDAVQETMLRAWRRRDSFDGGPWFRAWLYRIATNTCLDHLRRSTRRAPAGGTFAEVPWLQPYPDAELDEVAAHDDAPDVALVARETVELAFLAALQALPPRQRAVLLARDVLGWSAAETSALLDMTVPAANSALQRARATLGDRLPSRRGEWSVAEPTDDERAVMAEFMAAHERHDAAAAAAMLRDDIRITMPPHPYLFEGIDVVAPALATALGPEEVGDWRLVSIRANRMPAAASYLRAWGDSRFRAFKIDVVRFVDGKVAEVTTFGSEMFDRFGLPAVLEDAGELGA
jgi:RNA polymerase sigma-70 factor (ECF subfamily)